MKKLTKLIAGVTALILTFGIVGCGDKSTDYPLFRPSGDDGPIVETSETYTVNVRSAGGLKLNGVRVNALNSSGVKVRSGISADGVINFNLSLGSYKLEVDPETLPEGYYLEEGKTFSTNPEKRDEVNINIPSSVISQAASDGKVYTLGDIVNDFTLEDYRSGDEKYTGAKSYKLSDLLKRKKAVVLNFWYPQCPNCTMEFPYLQAAYAEAKKNVEVLGICQTTYGSKRYSNDDIKEYVENHSDKFNLTFPLGLDPVNLLGKFNVTGAPTTIVIDRYGMVAFYSMGAEPSVTFWQSLFKKYASDTYVQDESFEADTPDDGTGDNTSSVVQEKPDVTMPSPADMAAAASATGLNATYRASDEEYAWPWKTTSEDSVTAVTVTNTGKQNSYATLHVDVNLEKDDLLSFDYTVSSEANADALYVLLDGQLINGDGWSGEIPWTTADVYVANDTKTVELTFIYTKDEGDPSAEAVGKDCAKVRNIRTSKVSAETNAIDVIREAAFGKFELGKFENYKETYLGNDGFYHVGDVNNQNADDPMLYISLTNVTPWSEQRTENNMFESDEGTFYATLYLMSLYKYSETFEDEVTGETSFTVEIGDKDFAQPLQQYHHMLDMLAEPYQLMPVSEPLKQWAEAFVNQYEKEKGATAHEDEWLEFCFYYDHYGKPHESEETCLKNTDLTKGLTMYNPLEVAFSTSDPTEGTKMGTVRANVIYPLAQPNGLYYKFTAPKTGVYQIRDGGGSSVPDLTVLGLEQDGLGAKFISRDLYIYDFDQVIGDTVQITVVPQEAYVDPELEGSNLTAEENLKDCSFTITNVSRGDMDKGANTYNYAVEGGNTVKATAEGKTLPFHVEGTWRITVGDNVKSLTVRHKVNDAWVEEDVKASGNCEFTVKGNAYSSVNKYVKLQKGETVYLQFAIAEQVKGSFDFDIIYHEQVSTLMDCSTAAGAWTYDDRVTLQYIYLGIDEAYDSTTHKYYHADAEGNPDHSKPVYINMIYASYFISEIQGANNMSIEELINNKVFDDATQAVLLDYLDKAKKNTGDLYGLVEADDTIVKTINDFINRSNNGDRSDNRGWMAFACYREFIA